MDFQAWKTQQCERAVYRADEIINDLERVTGGGPLAHMLHRARIAAGVALDALVDVNPEDSQLIRTLQNEVQRHRDLVLWIGDAIRAAEDADKQLSVLEKRANTEFLVDENGAVTMQPEEFD
jgi:hypothetical protein